MIFHVIVYLDIKTKQYKRPKGLSVSVGYKYNAKDYSKIRYANNFNKQCMGFAEDSHFKTHDLYMIGLILIRVSPLS